MRAQRLQCEGFEIAWEWRGSYLRAHVCNGVDSLQVSIAMWNALADLCNSQRAHRLLVLEDLAGTVSEEQTPEVIAAMVASGLQNVRIAFVELRGHEQGNEHAEILALEHDIVVSVHANEAEAMYWLLYGGT